ncbi:hypothetical protein NECAME_14699 [Necator americanus]|uniref:Anoctamin dimerisation domain-containing protein n=1 Tax=Necator americanus TaxID=51031 RepID=W2SPC4_NECAM|nr:hypothetical protein NECAME_14699 [Necator americanus]ETN70552.1 hypothetical protein NECAME_14699 [Necator americanus]
MGQKLFFLGRKTAEDNNNDATSGSPSSAEIDQDDENEDKNSPNSAGSAKEKKQNRRFYFENNLRKMGLEIERVIISPMLGRTHFVLLHAPFPVLEKQAQLLTVKLPVQQSDVDFQVCALRIRCLVHAN